MSLGDKRFTSKCGWDVIQTEEVKEFIKRRLERIDLIIKLYPYKFHEELAGQLKEDLMNDAGKDLIDSSQVSPQEMKRSVGELNSEDKEPSTSKLPKLVEDGSDDNSVPQKAVQNDVCECGHEKKHHYGAYSSRSFMGTCAVVNCKCKQFKPKIK